jgi:diadenosine tetraphosphate (Ap4A) HIT family hydrolase
MALIFETENFIIESHEKPFVSREEGGHIRIRVKDENISDRTKLSVKQAKEFMRISMIVGEALEKGMKERGVEVIKVNYQDMGNWYYKSGTKPFFHCHVFGRVLGVAYQPFPESVYLPDRSTGFYDKFVPLNKEDIRIIKEQILEISKRLEYKVENWFSKND